MKKILIALSLLVLSATAFSAEVESITFDSIFLTKNTKNDYGVVYVPNRHVESWCVGMGNGMNVMSYEAAQTMNDLADGFYNCSGKFVQLSNDRAFPIQIFQLDSCTAVNAGELRAASCKKTK